MSKEVTEKIRNAEAEARKLVQDATEEGYRMLKATQEQIDKEMRAFSEKLKRERNERLLRCELKGQKTQEEAEEEIKKQADAARKKYEELSADAVRVAMGVLLGR